MSVTVPSPILAPPSAYDPLKNVIVTPGDPATNYVVVLVEEYVGDNVSDYDTSPSIRQVDRITGTLGDDFISTRLGADFIYGEGGNDAIRAGNGDDTISGGSGADRLYGGRGANTFLSEIDGFIDTIYLTAGQEQAPGNGKG